MVLLCVLGEPEYNFPNNPNGCLGGANFNPSHQKTSRPFSLPLSSALSNCKKKIVKISTRCKYVHKNTNITSCNEFYKFFRKYQIRWLQNDHIFKLVEYCEYGVFMIRFLFWNMFAKLTSLLKIYTRINQFAFIESYLSYLPNCYLTLENDKRVLHNKDNVRLEDMWVLRVLKKNIGARPHDNNTIASKFRKISALKCFFIVFSLSYLIHWKKIVAYCAFQKMRIPPKSPIDFPPRFQLDMQRRDIFTQIPPQIPEKSQK